MNFIATIPSRKVRASEQKLAVDRLNPLYSVMNKHLQLAGKIIISDKSKVINPTVEKERRKDW